MSREEFLKLDKTIEYYTNYLTRMRSLNEIIEESDPQSEVDSLKEIRVINNLQFILVISLLDLLVISRGIALARTQWEKVFYIKSGYLIIHGTVDSLEKSNKSIYDLISTKYSNEVGEFKKINAQIKTFKSENNFKDKIADIRNKVAAHIEPDLNVYYDIIKGMEGSDPTKAIKEFIPILMDFFEFNLNIILLGNRQDSQEYTNIHAQIMEKLDGRNRLFIDIP